MVNKQQDLDTLVKQHKFSGDTAKWALILGGSRGLGLATAEKLASHGYGLFIVHRDRRTDLPEIGKSFEAIRENGIPCITFNIDALNTEKRKAILSEISETLEASGKINVLVHSIAKGHVKPMAGEGPLLSHEDLLLTIGAMAVSLYDWSRCLIDMKLFAGDSRIISFTSEGSSKALPFYGAVGAAKAALEAISRNMALEFAPLGIRVNCIQAGVTETDSFAMIPGSDKIKAFAMKRNPSGRLTSPADVAKVVYLLTLEEAAWITGTVVKADGGESLK